jgi:hypothetical protein
VAPPGMTVIAYLPPEGVSHSARCYLYSPAIDPEVLPEVKR